MDNLRQDCPMRHRDNGNCQPAGGFCTAVNDAVCQALHNAYESGRYDALNAIREQNPLAGLPKIGDAVRDVRADYIFHIQLIEMGHKSGILFRCGNEGTEDYMAFYDFELGKDVVLCTEEKERT